jgi:hypothetical protein
VLYWVTTEELHLPAEEEVGGSEGDPAFGAEDNSEDTAANRLLVKMTSDAEQLAFSAMTVRGKPEQQSCMMPET